MKEFLLVYRSTQDAPPQMTPEKMQAMMKPWQDWLGGLAAQNKIASMGNRLSAEGRVIKPGNVVTNGPYVELKEGVGGYSIVLAESIDEAAELAKGCPILHVGGSVEVRPVA